MTQRVDPEDVLVERAHRMYSIDMEVLVRIPFEPLDISLEMIARELFKNTSKAILIRRAIEKLVKEGYGIRTYMGSKGVPCVYLEDSADIKRSQAKETANAYDKAVYGQQHIPRPKHIIPTKTKNENGKKSWPGYFKIVHAKSTVRSNRMVDSGYTEESRKKRNETVRLKKESL